MSRSLPIIDQSNPDHIIYDYPNGDKFWVTTNILSSLKIPMVLTNRDFNEVITLADNSELALLAYAKLVVKFRNDIDYAYEATTLARLLAAFWGKHSIDMRVARVYSDGSFILDIAVDEE